ncbi:nuclear transport factor 2 family protein [Streptomyces sp. NPDC052042]|uniref:nuclear transport factor 2 family protein n=1 Tax=Streptomyces sp. NPDC052042 TaxID=3365683 RepID=UPI0037D801D6
MQDGQAALISAASRTLRRYMELCDVPAVAYDREELRALFAPDAVWEGAGKWNAERFGRVSGADRIVEMLETRLPPNPHFTLNAHLLGRGTLKPCGGSGTGVEGQWPMVRLSTYTAGGANITLTELRVWFEADRDRALITEYRPRRLWSQALDPEQARALAFVLGVDTETTHTSTRRAM